MKRIFPAGCVMTLAAIASTLVVAQDKPQLSFFITSANPGKGADLGGLDGADKYCQTLAAAAGAGSRTWRAYLSTSAANGSPVNSRRVSRRRLMTS